jgi:hypothetical protein
MLQHTCWGTTAFRCCSFWNLNFTQYSDVLRAWLPGFDSRQEQEVFSLDIIQTCSRTHSGSYLMGTGGSFHGRRRPWREADHLHPSSAEFKNDGTIPPLPHVFMGWWLLTHRNSFTI